MKSAIGIDPGKSGYGFLLCEDNHYEFFGWPGLNLTFLILQRWQAKYDIKTAVLEDIPTLPGKPGFFNNTKLNRNFGQWEGLLMGAVIKRDYVKPKEWQSILLPARPGWTTTKHRSVITAQALIPGIDKHVHLKKHHNIADAALLAYIGLNR
ncbi:MAG: hypothetical protein GY841_12325 [FCB group bacterium]|nr:hypothetical protein [FCB group bacterium]